MIVRGCYWLLVLADGFGFQVELEGRITSHQNAWNGRRGVQSFCEILETERTGFISISVILGLDWNEMLQNN